MQYIPIMRLGPVETALLNDLHGLDVFPLLEVIEPRNFLRALKSAKSDFGNNFMVELPLYLSGTDNKYRAGVSQLIAYFQTKDKSAQTNFYIKYKDIIPIPVISAPERGPSGQYSEMASRFQEIKDHFERVAFRMFIFHYDLTEQEKNQIKIILDLMRGDDLLLLDVVQFEGLQSGVVKNLSEIVEIKSNKGNKNKVFVLNAFDIRDIRCETHNYGPLLCKKMNLDGLGDFATMRRVEPLGGGGSPTRIIRYYDPWNYKLVPFVSTSGGYTDALTRLKTSGEWARAVSEGHVRKCKACKEAEVTRSRDHRFWKRFRILHHVKSMVADTITMMGKCSNPDDLDMDGYHNLYAKTGD